MTLNEYQDKAFSVAYSPDKIHWSTLPIGLSSEVGELSKLIYKAKVIYDNQFGPMARQDIALELGDILWYIAILSKEFGFDLDEIAEMNYTKLKNRREKE